MAGGGPLGYLVEHPEEMALWEQYAKREPLISEYLLGLNVNLARIGMMLEQIFAGKKAPAHKELVKVWCWWLDKEGDKQAPEPPAENADNEMLSEDQIEDAWGDIYDKVRH